MHFSKTMQNLIWLASLREKTSDLVKFKIKKKKNWRGYTLCVLLGGLRGDALAAFIGNYIELMDLARLQDVKTVMSTFKYLCSCSVGKITLKQADNFSKTLQNPSISAAQGQEIAHLVIETLWKDRCDEKFELFWSNLINKKTELDLADPKLPRTIKLPDFHHS